MNKEDLIVKISKAIHIKKDDVSTVLNGTILEINTALVNKESIIIANFGTFKPILRKPRKVNNPKTGKSFMWPGGWKIKFKASKNVEGLINASKANS